MREDLKKRDEAELHDLRGSRSQRYGRWAGWVFGAGLVAYLLHQLAEIGWAQVWEAVPRTPLFYGVFVVLYLALPLFEAAVYRLVWEVRPDVVLPALIRKRIFSKYVLDYSGEAYLYWWARRRLGRPTRQLLAGQKDNLLLSSATSTAFALALLGGLVVSGAVAMPGFLRMQDSDTAVLGLVAAGLAILAVHFRRRILSLPGRVLVQVAVLHLGRLTAVHLLQVVLWCSAAPQVPLTAWLTLLAAQVAIGRLPLLPHRDLALVGVGIELAASLGAPAAVVASVLLAAASLEKLLSLVLFAGLGGRKAWSGRTSPAQPSAPPVAANSLVDCENL